MVHSSESKPSRFPEPSLVKGFVRFWLNSRATRKGGLYGVLMCLQDGSACCVMTTRVWDVEHVGRRREAHPRVSVIGMRARGCVAREYPLAGGYRYAGESLAIQPPAPPFCLSDLRQFVGQTPICWPCLPSPFKLTQSSSQRSSSAGYNIDIPGVYTHEI